MSQFETLPNKHPAGGILYCRNKGAEARGQRTANGFVVFKGSTAVLKHRPSAESSPWIVVQRRLLANHALLPQGDYLVFEKDTEFASPSAAAAVIHGGTANGLIAGKTQAGKSLKELNEED